MYHDLTMFTFSEFINSHLVTILGISNEAENSAVFCFMYIYRSVHEHFQAYSVQIAKLDIT